MQGLALTIAPIFVIVVLGNILRRLGMPGDGFWPLASRLGYWVLIPSLLFYKLSTADVQIDRMAPFALGLGGAFFLVGFVVLAVSWGAGMPAPQRGSVLQGAVRHNSFMALAVAETLYGAEGLSMAALAAAVLALVTNVAIVPALRLLDTRSGGAMMGRQVLRDIACNPLILSICAGLAVNGLVPGRIPVLHDATAMLGAVALPLRLDAPNVVKTALIEDGPLPESALSARRRASSWAAIALSAVCSGRPALKMMVPEMFSASGEGKKTNSTRPERARPMASTMTMATAMESVT